MDVDILINKNVLPMPAVSASVSCMDLGNLADSIKKSRRLRCSIFSL